MIETIDIAVPAAFDEHCRAAMTELRAAVLKLYRSVSADPDKPQDVSRRFGVNRNLAWQVSRILREDEALDAVPLVPRAGAVEIMLNAIRAAGAPADLVLSAQRAFADFDAMVETHVGDRGELDLLLDSMGRGSQKPLEMSRKLAFRGNSGLWGMKVATRVTAQFIAPNHSDPTMLDAAQIAGLSRARRFRPVTTWPVFRIGRFVEGSAPTSESDRLPIDPNCTEHPGLIADFCSGEMPKLSCTQRGDGIYYDVGDGPVGRRGEFTCYFGYLHENFVSRYAHKPDGRASVAAALTMPAETLLFDLFVHKDVDCEVLPRADVFGKLWDESGSFDASTKLPIDADVIDMGTGGRPGSRLVERYDELLSTVFQRAGWSPAEFRCHRVVIEYPPMSSVIAIHLKLPRALPGTTQD